MKEEISTLKREFKHIIQVTECIEKRFVQISQKLNVLKSEYNVFRSTNKASIHVFCLDSICFQLRLYKSYHNSYHKLYETINNHLYRDYYKLWKRLQEYVTNNIADKQVNILFENADFPFYDDTNINNTYELKMIYEIHDSILNVIQTLHNYCKTKEDKLPRQDLLIKKGYDLVSLNATYKYNNRVIESNIQLYLDLLIFYKSQKMKYLTEHHKKLIQLYNELPPIDQFTTGTGRSSPIEKFSKTTPIPEPYISNHQIKESPYEKPQHLTLEIPYNLDQESDLESDTQSVSSIIDKFNKNDKNNKINNDNHIKRNSWRKSIDTPKVDNIINMEIGISDTDVVNEIISPTTEDDNKVELKNNNEYFKFDEVENVNNSQKNISEISGNVIESDISNICNGKDDGNELNENSTEKKISFSDKVESEISSTNLESNNELIQEDVPKKKHKKKAKKKEKKITASTDMVDVKTETKETKKQKK